MNVIVTGVAGYIGGQIALQLKGAGHTVIGIDRRPLQKHQVGQLDTKLFNNLVQTTDREIR